MDLQWFGGCWCGVAAILALESHGCSVQLFIIMILAIVCCCHIVSACWGPHVLSGCHIVSLLCSVQEGSHANAITMTWSQRQEQEQFHNQPATMMMRMPSQQEQEHFNNQPVMNLDNEDSTITMMMIHSQQQHFHNQPAMNHDNDTIHHDNDAIMMGFQTLWQWQNMLSNAILQIILVIFLSNISIKFSFCCFYAIFTL